MEVFHGQPLQFKTAPWGRENLRSGVSAERRTLHWSMIPALYRGAATRKKAHGVTIHAIYSGISVLNCPLFK